MPSVSAIIRMAYNPGLERWKHGKIVEACYNCPPGGGETLEDYQQHILQKADEERNDAADLGTRIHAGIENYYKGSDKPLDADIKDYVFAAVDAVDSLHIKPLQHEATVISLKDGYAGTTDMTWTNADGFVGILDFKSMKTKPEEPIVPKPTHAAQIAAYHMAHWVSISPHNAMGYNIYISTTEPGRVNVTTYRASTLLAEWEWFQACLVLWRHKNKYDPRCTDF